MTSSKVTENGQAHGNVANTEAVFFPNITLGYGSPKYVNQLLDVEQCLRLKSITTVEPFQPLRQEVPLGTVATKRTFFGRKIHQLFTLGGKINSYKMLHGVVKPLTRFSLVLRVCGLAIRSYFVRTLVLTTYPHWSFGLFSSSTIMCANFSEIWTEFNLYSANLDLKTRVKGPLLARYYRQVSFCIAPQEDRLAMAAKLYSNAKMVLAQNCPRKDQVEPIEEATSTKRLLYQGRIGKEANAELIITLANQLDDDIEFHIVGLVDAEYKADIDRLDSEGKVTYHGFMTSKQLGKIRQKCNIGLVSWNNETLNTRYCAPNKLYEYIASGIYVVSFYNVAMRQFNEKYRFGQVESVPQTKLAEFINQLTVEEIKQQRTANIEIYQKELNYEKQYAPFRQLLEQL